MKSADEPVRLEKETPPVARGVAWSPGIYTHDLEEGDEELKIIPAVCAARTARTTRSTASVSSAIFHTSFRAEIPDASLWRCSRPSMNTRRCFGKPISTEKSSLHPYLNTMPYLGFGRGTVFVISVPRSKFVLHTSGAPAEASLIEAMFLFWLSAVAQGESVHH